MFGVDTTGTTINTLKETPTNTERTANFIVKFLSVTYLVDNTNRLFQFVVTFHGKFHLEFFTYLKRLIISFRGSYSFWCTPPVFKK